MFNLRLLVVLITGYHSSSLALFRVLECIGAVAYKLELPPAVVIHPVFHVSQLKCSPGANKVSSVLPTGLVMFQVPEQIIQ